MAWQRPGNNPLSESVVFSLTMHIYVTRPQWVNINRQECHPIRLYVLPIKNRARQLKKSFRWPHWTKVAGFVINVSAKSLLILFGHPWKFLFWGLQRHKQKYPPIPRVLLGTIHGKKLMWWYLFKYLSRSNKTTPLFFCLFKQICIWLWCACEIQLVI